MHIPPAKELNFDIDKYLGPIIPASRLHRLPRPISHFLGFRETAPKPIGNIPVAAWGFLGGFCGTAALGGLFMADFIKDKGGPIIIGSYGAAAILEYNAIESPFSQPRNQILGQLLAALVGVSVTKLFALSPNFEELRWLAGALSVGLASAIMSLTKTIHPPSGATALLAAIEPAISGLGWLYVAIVLLCSIITTAVACLLNNIQRQYPLYWWAAQGKISTAKQRDEEKNGQFPESEKDASGEARMDTHDSSEVIIRARGILIPTDFYLAANEEAVLRILEGRLREYSESASDGDTSSETGASTISKSRSNDSR